MNILITSGKARGSTDLSAFDKALKRAGIHNLNLIKLSSVIPKNEGIIKRIPRINDNHYGDKLYIVLSKSIEDKKGEYACAGLGWSVSEKGEDIFIEHEANSDEKVRKLIKETMNQMKSYRKRNYENVNYNIEKIKCNGLPVCSIVCACYCIEDWKNNISYFKEDGTIH